MLRAGASIRSPNLADMICALDLHSLILPGVILLMAVVTGLVEPRFWSIENLINLSRQISPLLIVSVGQAVAVLSGGLDLSIAATLALSGICGVMIMNHAGIAAGIVAMIGTGIGCGLVNGLIITRFQVSPFIVTLGTLSVGRGLALIASGGLPIYQVPDFFVDTVGFGQILGIPVGAVIAVATLIGGALLLRFTIFGRYVYAIGSSTAAAFHSGVNVRLYVLLVYAFAGLTAGLAAIVLTAWVAAAQPLAAQGLELQSLGAVVIGGIALTGGSGSLLNMCYGVLILGMLSNSLNMIGMSSFMQTLTIGVVIVAAVVLDKLRRA